MKSQIRAERAGREAGKNAGAWATDGNTTRATYEKILRGIDECDPEVMNALPCLDLSGQWADGLTDADVLSDIGYCDVERMLEREPDRCSDLIGWYRDGYDAAVVAEVERACRLQLAE